MRSECPRCGKVPEQEGAFCAYCGAAMQGLCDASADVVIPSTPKGSVDWYKKAILFVTSALLIGVAVVLVLLLDQPIQVLQVASTSRVELPIPTNTPIFSSATHTIESQILGLWTATRMEPNTKKSKTLFVDTGITDVRTSMCFFTDGTVLITTAKNQEPLQNATTLREWYAIGDDVFVDYGNDTIHGTTYFGSTRFFIKNENLMSVYTLDGKEVSDFIVFTREMVQPLMPQGL